MMDTGVGHGVKEFVDIAVRKSKMIKVERLTVIKVDVLDLNKNEIYKFLGCKHSSGHGRIKERNKKEAGQSNGTGFE